MTDSKSLSDLQFFHLNGKHFIAAAANICDYFDTRVDRLNNRKLIIDQTIKRREAILVLYINRMMFSRFFSRLGRYFKSGFIVYSALVHYGFTLLTLNVLI